jgi:alkylation response protein AidB-like acyl-CoA dehydrogenase
MSAPAHIEVAKKDLNFLAQLMVRKHYADFWEDETRTLPFSMRRLRRKYKKYAGECLRPLAAQGDADPSGLDKTKIFLEYARRGLATELLPSPWGTMSWSAVARRSLLPSILKVEEMCAACSGLSVMLGAHDLGMGPLLMSGSLSAFYRFVLPTYKKIKHGEKCMWAFAITEPGAGSDVEDVKGAAGARVVTRAKKVAGGYRINGRKVFITSGAIADYITLFACLGDEGLASWTCFVIEPTMEGFARGRQERKMGQKAADASELILDNVFVPDKNRVGPERSGWALSQLVLTGSRPVVGGVALGIARGALEGCLDFCRTARLGPKTLFDYQEVRLELAEMMIKIMAARATAWNMASRFIPPSPATSAAAKVFCSDTATEVCERALGLMGDHAYLASNSLEKSLRDARVTQIYEGTNQINRLALVEDLWDRDR